MHYYSFNVGDYIKDTSHLSLIEDLAYRRLIDLYYTTEAAIDPNIKAIARKIRMSEHEQVIETILGEFFTQNTDGFWENKRCQNDLDLIYKKSQKARESAKARWSGNKETQKESESNADGMRTHSERNAEGMLHNTQYPIPNTQNTEPKEKQSAKAPAKKTQKAAFVLPDWFTDSDVKNWDAWNSIAKRRNATHAQLAISLEKLSKWRDKGVDWSRALENSAVGGWQGLFEPAQVGASNGSQRGVFNKAQAIQDANNAVVAQMFGDDDAG